MSFGNGRRHREPPPCPSVAVAEGMHLRMGASDLVADAIDPLADRSDLSLVASDP
jgi:hypothetical protein